jgi:integrase
MVSCMRRSEIAALDLSDLVRAPEGLRVTIQRSKGDQDGVGATIAIPAGRRLRPVAHLDAWLARAAIADGPLFRRLSQCGTRVLPARMSDRSVAEIVKARAKAAGLDPEQFAGHSLRAGFLTAAARAGASVWKMQEQSRHKSLNVLSGYVRSAQLFEDHAGKDFA